MEHVENKAYVEFRNSGYRVAGTRVSLDSLVYCWREGLSPETIQRDCFNTLTLSQVFGALAYYLDHQAQIDQYLIEKEAREEEFAKQLREQYPAIHQKLDQILAAGQTQSR